MPIWIHIAFWVIQGPLLVIYHSINATPAPWYKETIRGFGTGIGVFYLILLIGYWLYSAYRLLAFGTRSDSLTGLALYRNRGIM